MSAAKGLKLVVLLLRIATAAAVVVPFAVYYTSSESLTDFVLPKVETTQMPNPRFDILSFNVKESSSGYVLEVKLLNTGDVTLGIKELEGEFSPVNRDFKGKFSLETPIALAPGREGILRVVLLPEQGDPEELEEALSRDEAFNVSGRATLVLGEAELPFSFTTELKLSEVVSRGGL